MKTLCSRSLLARTPVAAAAALASAVLLSACMTKPPKEEMAVSKSAVERASTSQTTASAAPLEMQLAREKYARAQQAMKGRDYKLARRLAQEAEADAKLAEAKAAASKNTEAADELRGLLKTLNQEIERAQNANP